MTLIDRTGPAAALPQPPAGPVRLLDGVGAQAASLGHHRATYPTPPVPRAPRLDLIDLVEQAGLRGRGGASFPTATKLRAVAAAGTSATVRPIVVVNGSEGEPLSRKDVLLLARAPHLVLDGAALAAVLVGADEVHVAGDRAEQEALQAVDRAILERRAAREPLAAACHLRPGPGHYVAGEESALVRHLNGGPALPTSLTIRPFHKGVADRPTLILNAETAAHLTQILTWGPAWFRSVGTDLHPGTALVTVTGGTGPAVVREVVLGTSLAAIAGLAGGLPSSPQAVLVGGYFGSWLPAADAIDVGLCDEQLRPRGAAVGCGALAFLPADACGLQESARVFAWLAGQSAGQCGPCTHGLPAMAEQLVSLALGTADEHAVARLHHWAGQVDGRGACRLPDGAIRFLRSALRVFADDVARHAAGHPCPTGPPLLPTPHSPVAGR